MDNQQTKIEDVAWLAGFLDGEACLDLQKSNNKSHIRDRYYPRIRVSSTAVNLVDEVGEIFHQLGVGYHVSWRHPTNPKWRSSWTIEISGLKRMQTLLTQITPLLRVKGNRAVMLLDFINARAQHSQYDPYNEIESDLIARLRQPQLL